jgi:hypothetical protein
LTDNLAPNAWRPIPAYGSLDQPTYNIDLTPFIPILTDGATHNLTIDVLSAEDDHAVNSHWWISGLVQVNNFIFPTCPLKPTAIDRS